MEWAPVNPVVRELAEESVEGTDLGSLADLARTLAGSGFEPRFELEPGLRAGLERALPSRLPCAQPALLGLSGQLSRMAMTGTCVCLMSGLSGQGDCAPYHAGNGPTPLMPELPEWYVRVKWKEGRS